MHNVWTTVLLLLLLYKEEAKRTSFSQPYRAKMYGIGANGAGLALGGVRDLGLGARRQGVRQPYFVLLVIGLLNQISNLRRKPPATLVLMAGMSVLYLRPDLFEDLFIAGSNSGGPSVPRGRFDIVQSMCMLPSAILDGFGK